MTDETLGRKKRLRGRAALNYVLTHPDKQVISGETHKICICPNTEGYPRLGIRVAKKQNPLACKRNRIRRMVRACFRTRVKPDLGVDVVFVGGFMNQGEERSQAEIKSLFNRVNREPRT